MPVSRFSDQALFEDTVVRCMHAKGYISGAFFPVAVVGHLQKIAVFGRAFSSQGIYINSRRVSQSIKT